jgi:hypothetical protein
MLYMQHPPNKGGHVWVYFQIPPQPGVPWCTPWLRPKPHPTRRSSSLPHTWTTPGVARATTQGGESTVYIFQRPCILTTKHFLQFNVLLTLCRVFSSGCICGTFRGCVRSLPCPIPMSPFRQTPMPVSGTPGNLLPSHAASLICCTHRPCTPTHPP